MTHINTSLLHAYVDNELTPGQLTSIDSHLEICPQCDRELKRLRLLKSTLADITSPLPDSDYYVRLQDRIKARTIDQGEAVSRKLPISPVVVAPGQTLLRTLIRLAAVLILLFASFYMAQFVQQNRNERWAESVSENGLVQEDKGDPETENVEISPGINRVGSPAPAPEANNQKDNK